MKTMDPQRMDSWMNGAAQQLGVSPDALRNAMQSGNTSQLLSKMNPEDARMLQQALSDKNTAARILSSPEAQAIMQKLFGSR